MKRPMLITKCATENLTCELRPGDADGEACAKFGDGVYGGFDAVSPDGSA